MQKPSRSDEKSRIFMPLWCIRFAWLAPLKIAFSDQLLAVSKMQKPSRSDEKSRIFMPLWCIRFAWLAPLKIDRLGSDTRLK
jgi:hypothetical protein